MSTQSPPSPTPPSDPNRGRNALALIALIIAVAAFLLGLIPFVGFVSWLIAAAAIVIAIVALARPVKPKGMAVGGLVLGVIALVVGPSVAIASVVGVAAAGVQAAGASESAKAERLGGVSSAAPTENSSPNEEPSEDSSESEGSAAAEPAVKTKTYKGSSDKVLKLDISDPIVITFTCANCSSNTTVETDSGTDTLPVNTIGSYKGTHLLNTSDGALLTKIKIGANAAWKLKVEDVTTFAKRIKHVSVGATIKGSGDDVIYVDEGVTDSDVQNKGSGNFSLTSYGGSDGLPVNEIGSYRGNVELDGPAAVQVSSDGTWQIKGNG